MSDFNAAAFAKWLKAGFDASPFKTQNKLVEAVESNKATISRLMNASPQSLTGKASQPERELVIKLAEKLKIDVDEGLMAAGYAPSKIVAEQAVRIGKGVLLVFPEKCNVTEVEKQNLITLNRLLINGLLANRLIAVEPEQGKHFIAPPKKQLEPVDDEIVYMSLPYEGEVNKEDGGGQNEQGKKVA